MEYNIGDKVTIKSLKWYDKNKDSDGTVHVEFAFAINKYTRFYPNSIKYWSKNKEDLEIFINAEKYNL